MTTLAYKVDRLHLCCPACHHTWRPRLHERGPIFQLIVWPLLFVGAALGIVVIWLAAIGKLP